ncbi:haloacid dehalogenase superfamily, subfamily IA, variant 3 with third motif having DD or ED [Arthrobacter alpinus]|uniref:Haloacid dehalogenase superfamily, subfamily IA, variant 3 with third motif having DD or ED n=1 Tax=Arthrobacter alpinus TaxID=656366 RepID=A0A1H5IZP8_9MICC|nr:HAD family hydrolase [Arthrobacter alpinus]SEE45672.1 haloacid dehalogenase superfamily, subfamily IA, variant 3 with third motif having DD or ED [Arthrobacter alpinus]
MLAPSSAVNPATSTTPVLKAVLWDMDGTLVDTEPYWIAAEIALVTAHGGYWNEDMAHTLVGNALGDSAKILQGAGVKLSVREIIDHLSAEVVACIRREIPWRPGARELLSDLHGRGVRCALVTMSERALATEVVNSLEAEYFEFLVTGDEVTNGKPHPEPYLTAIELLRENDPAITAAHCAALEDSVPGVASAVASGVATIAIPNAVELAEDARWTTWETLAGKTGDDVTDVIAAHSRSAGAAL